ncbi:MAG: CHAT domain-containing protein [Leptolyngbyaceae cyanobacterium]
MGKRYKHVLMAIATALLCLVASPAIAHLTATTSGDSVGTALIRPRLTTAQTLENQGRERYEAGQFQDAVRLLQQAVEAHTANGQILQQAIALSNLSLAQQALGDWDAATRAIDTSLEILNGLPEDTGGNATVTAQALSIQGRLQFAQGQFQAAFDTWQQVTDYHQQQGNDSLHLESQLNQVQALQALGFYKQAIDQLTAMQSELATQPDSAAKVMTLSRLGNALRLAGYLGNPDLTQVPFGEEAAPMEGNTPAVQPDGTAIGDTPGDATTVLTEALELAQQLRLPDAIATISIHLGDIAYSQAREPKAGPAQADWFDQAMIFYGEAIAQSPAAIVQTKASLRQLNVAIAREQWAIAQRLRTQIQLQLQSIAPSRTTIYQRVQLAEGFIQIKQTLAASGFTDRTLQPIQWSDIANLLATANRQAENLGDNRVQAYVLGTLGHVYEQANRQDEAIQLTQQALQLSLATNASDMTYQWYWQLARLHRQELKQFRENTLATVPATIVAQKRQDAIMAYQQAIASIKQLRVDLAAVDPEAQFSFRDEIEPIYRDLVSLLLDPGASPSAQDIETARQTIEDLQLAELDNFFRESCLNAQDVDIDDLDRQAAVIYPIVLSDRLEVIVNLPEKEGQRTLRHFSQLDISDTVVERQMRLIRRQMRGQLSADAQGELQSLLAELYDWLILPFAADLQASGTETLVFVLDGPLRNIPMAALYDGDRYLIETYSVALSLGLQLTPSARPNVQDLDVLLGGLSESRENSPELPNVTKELDQIATTVAASQQLLNEQFTNQAVQRRVNATSSPVVHLATHGNFDDQYEETYLQTWDNRLNIRELSTLLQSSELNRRRPIELLVLSACQTAEGNDRAALGLAGMAVRSGARSTLATLWSVYDQSTAELMQDFYEIWVDGGVTKAEALRQAQEKLLKTPEFSLPYYWAPFVLLGNWL